MNETITTANVLKVLEEVVAEHDPGYGYDQRFEEITGLDREANDTFGTCRYKISDTPGCLVGVVMDRLGVEIDHDWEMESFDNVVNRTDLNIEDEAARLLTRAQESQDNGQPWSYAVRFARRVVNL